MWHLRQRFTLRVTWRRVARREAAQGRRQLELEDREGFLQPFAETSARPRSARPCEPREFTRGWDKARSKRPPTSSPSYVPAEALAALIDQALATISPGGWPTRAQIPPTFVCRDCGEVMLGNPPPTCPVCRARALTFHKIGPFYLELLDVAHVLPALAASVAEAEVICAGVTEAQARSGPWPMRAIVAHQLGAERLAVGRAVRVIEEDDPELASVSWTVTVAPACGI